MSSKPTPLPQFLPLALSFMRLPSSSSLILASLAVSSSSSSLSALAVPVGDGAGADAPSSPAPAPPHAPVAPPAPIPPHAPIPHGSDDTATDHLQTRNIVDGLVTPISPELAKLLHGILGPILGNDAPKAREEPLDLVKHLAPTGKTSRAEKGDESGVDDGSTDEDSSSQPSASQAEVSAPPMAGHQDPPVAPLNPPADFPSPSLPSPFSPPPIPPPNTPMPP